MIEESGEIETEFGFQLEELFQNIRVKVVKFIQ